MTAHQHSTGPVEPDRDPAGDQLDEVDRQRYVEELAALFPERGWNRMEARVLSYLMLSPAPYVSTAELIDSLRASAGSISLATRALAEPGFIRRVTVPGDRSHYFRVDDDVWGTFLATEHQYLMRRAEGVDEVIAALRPGDDGVRTKLENMRDYHTWLYNFHQTMRVEWERYKNAKHAERRDR